ncbi:MAG TPA: ABC transporter permease subunit [Gemmataceae bacterium]|jgi:ABC-type transport system involved in multi-copper enzyme maturation permease subunit|nr:ABC transporter permease subunit [Gemmataceae bacterium]
MVGPVLYLEMLLSGRRGRQHVFRWVYAGWLVVQLCFLYFLYRLSAMRAMAMSMRLGRPDPNVSSAFAASFVELFVVQQLVLLLLATPAFAAGAITDEKSRGTLQYLLTADLSAWEIVIGKLLGRMAQVGVLVLAGLPLLCFIGVFGGLDPLAVAVIAVVTVMALFALAAASILASVWSRQTRDAVLGLYAVGGLGYLLFWGIGALHAALAAGSAGGLSATFWGRLLDRLHGLLRPFNPLFVLEPAWGHGNLGLLGQRLLLAALAWGSVGLLCLVLAAWRLRGAYIRQLEGEGKQKKPRWWRARRQPVGAEPVRWKERQVDGIAPLPALRGIPGWLGVLGVCTLTVLSSGAILWRHLPGDVTVAGLWRKAASFDVPGLADVLNRSDPAGGAFLVQGIVVMLLASLIVGIRCSGAVSGERERQTWEALLLTPLETRQLIRGKLWGIIGAGFPYLRAYAIPAILLSLFGGGFAVFWTVVWLAVTWLAMYYVGAAGLWCSTRSLSSWRSLLGTLGFSYVGGFVIYVCTSPIIVLAAVVIVLALMALDNLLQISTAGRAARFFTYYWDAFWIASCLVLAGVFFGIARYLIGAAEKRVSNLERTRHWKNEPANRRRRRSAARSRYYR